MRQWEQWSRWSGGEARTCLAARAAVGLLAALALSGCGAEIETPPTTRPSFLVLLVDTLRADHLPIYGYARDTAPTLTRLARDGWTFEHHLAQAGQTVPATVSLLVSQYPAEHGLVHRKQGQFGRTPPVFRDELDFVSESFRAAGYATAAFVGNPLLKHSHGFGQGFAHFVQGGPGEGMTEHVVSWLKRRAAHRETPFFGYVHWIDVHHPYEHPDRYARLYREEGGGRIVHLNGRAPEGLTPVDLDYTVASYDAGINYIDDQLARVLDTLEELGLRDDTVVVFTSDHGDEFVEHGGFGHGTHVYGELVRVPLVLSRPGHFDGGRRVQHPSTHVDLAPTLLELAGIRAPASFRGGSLLEPTGPIFVEDLAWRGVHAREHKLVRNIKTGESALFRLEDRLDQEPVENAAVEAELSRLLDAYIGRGGSRESDGLPERAADWTDEEVEQLRVLGYVDD